MFRSSANQIAIFFLFLTTTLSAQPDWTLIPSDFQYSMTVTGAAVFQCIESTDENDMIAAFIDGEVRGVQLLNTDFEGRKLAFMIIYDNDFIGNEVTFKMYDASKDSIYDAVQSVEFVENGKLGDADYPFLISTEYTLTSLFLTQDSIPAAGIEGQTIASIYAVNENQDTLSINYEFVDGEFGLDNHYFSISGNSLILTEDVNGEVKNSYQLHLSGTNALGCSVDVVFELFVEGYGTTSLFAIDKGRSTQDLGMYPNPASSVVTIDAKSKIDQLSIFDFSGKRVYSITDLPASYVIDVSTLAPQLYFVVCHVEGGISTGKLLVQR